MSPQDPMENPWFHWLALERIPRVGPLTIARLIAAFGTPAAALEADRNRIARLAGLGEKLAGTIADFVIPVSEIVRDLETLQRHAARVVLRWDEDYPSNLETIYDPPAMLFVRGAILPRDTRGVAIVGTRTPTRYGLEVTERIATDLVRANITLISGLARGIDTACHRAALKAGGRTIGVLGCGIDVTYPRENQTLIEEIAASGAVISEFRPGVPPLGTNFYRRNRVVSGLAKGVLVVEAGMNSGSLITASHAVEQNRDVFAVPGNIWNRRSLGPHHLIKQGAGLVESSRDVIEALFEPVQAPVRPSPFQQVEPTEELSDDERSILEALDLDPIPIDALGDAVRMEPGKIAALLLQLELNGLVRQHPGKLFSRHPC